MCLFPAGPAAGAHVCLSRAMMADGNPSYSLSDHCVQDSELSAKFGFPFITVVRVQCDDICKVLHSELGTRSVS